jgi:hypothetical protein
MVIDKTKIEKQAKTILDNFVKSLNKVEEGKEHDFFIDREEFTRVEGEGIIYNKEFKERFLKNSANHDNEFIIGEKGDWKK